MATATSAIAVPAPARAATPISKVYDPIKTVDGMFNGSLIRIAYVLKDPKTYGESTKIILAECTKKYQDALDDCEIQILDAKWYLEHKLAENKRRREAEAMAREKEANAATDATKRKHDEVQEADATQQPDTPTKRAKSEGQPSPRSTAAVQNLSSTEEQLKPESSPQPSLSTPRSQHKEPPKFVKQETPVEEGEQEEKQLLDPTTTQQEQHSNADDFTKQTPQGTPAMTNEEGFNFDSMFDDIAEDSNDAGNVNNEDTNATFGMEDAFAHEFGAVNSTNSNTNTQDFGSTQKHIQMQRQISSQKQDNNDNNDTSSLGSLLPGLETYANQPDDTSNNNLSQSQNNNIANQDTSNMFTEEFGGSNIFDQMLANDDFDIGGGGGTGAGAVEITDFGNGNNNDLNIAEPDNEMNFDDLFGEYED